VVDIIWEDPPEHAVESGQRSRYAEFQAALRENPQRWAVLPGPAKASTDSAKGTAMNIRNGRMRGFTKGQFETRVAGVKIYVRYVGPTDGAATPAPAAAETSDGSTSAESKHPAGAVRAWARSTGREVPDHGRLPNALIEAYEAHLAEQASEPSVAQEPAPADQ
jgi:hypothetical protein